MSQVTPLHWLFAVQNERSPCFAASIATASRREPAVAQRRVRGDAGEPAADDRDVHYFTEPASSPWTK